MDGQGCFAHVGGGGQEHQAPQAEQGFIQAGDCFLGQADEIPALESVQAAVVGLQFLGQVEHRGLMNIGWGHQGFSFDFFFRCPPVIPSQSGGRLPAGNDTPRR